MLIATLVRAELVIVNRSCMPNAQPMDTNHIQYSYGICSGCIRYNASWRVSLVFMCEGYALGIAANHTTDSL